MAKEGKKKVKKTLKLKSERDLLKDILKCLDEISDRLKKLEHAPDDTFDILKKITEEQDKKPKPPIFPTLPWPDPNTVPYPTPPKPKFNGCRVCGIEWGNGGWGYVCTRYDCPTRITSDEPVYPKWESFGSKESLTQHSEPTCVPIDFEITATDDVQLDVYSDGQSKVSFESCVCGANKSCQCAK